VFATICTTPRRMALSEWKWQLIEDEGVMWVPTSGSHDEKWLATDYGDVMEDDHKLGMKSQEFTSAPLT
jgi:hypothetical protein